MFHLARRVIPLNVDYAVGEKMVYDSTITGSYDSAAATGTSTLIPKNTTINSQQTIEVTGFDGEYYTLNHTMTMNLNNKPISFSMIEKMNKTGYSAYLVQHWKHPARGIQQRLNKYFLSCPAAKPARSQSGRLCKCAIPNWKLKPWHNWRFKNDFQRNRRSHSSSRHIQSIQNRHYKQRPKNELSIAIKRTKQLYTSKHHHRHGYELSNLH